jgi:predicted ester cyclase
VIHPEDVNLEASRPPVSRGQGPAAFHAIALRPRGAFSELRWEARQTAAESDLVAIHSTWSGRHVRPFVTYDDAGAVAQAMPSTSKTFAATQSHWYRHADGKIIEHWTNRDDLATGQQLGWIPPSPGYLVRMARQTPRTSLLTSRVLINAARAGMQRRPTTRRRGRTPAGGGDHQPS